MAILASGAVVNLAPIYSFLSDWKYITPIIIRGKFDPSCTKLKDKNRTHANNYRKYGS